MKCATNFGLLYVMYGSLKANVGDKLQLRKKNIPEMLKPDQANRAFLIADWAADVVTNRPLIAARSSKSWSQ